MSDYDAAFAAATGGGAKSDDPYDAVMSGIMSQVKPVNVPTPTPATAAAPAKPVRGKFDLRGEAYDKMVNYSPADSIGGQVRGAGSIGATLLAPIDAAARFVNGGKPINIGGYDIAGQDRRAGMDAGLQGMGVDTKSTQFGTNKLIAEVAGTAGAGGAAANVLGRIPGAATQAPALLNAIRTGGMTTGAPATASRVADMGVRVAGGAVNGALTAGAVNPEDAGAGMMFGGAFPVAAKALGVAGDAIGGLFRGAPIANPTKLQTAKESIEAGYVVPPSMINPSFKNRVLESTSGKQATAQIAATRNQAVTEDLARKSLPGLATDAPLTFETMAAYRKAQHTAGYEPLRQVGTIPAGAKFNQELDAIANQYKGKGTIPAIAGGKQEITDLAAAHKSNAFDVGDAVDAIRVLREDATALFRSTNAGDKAKAKATKAIADAYENAIDDALKAGGQSDLLGAYRAARQNIAKSGTVEKAIREGSGTLDARIIAREFQKNPGKLSGELKTIGQFANTFDKAAQPPHLIGSPAVHNLTAMYSTGAGATGAGLGAMVGGPAGAAVGATLGAAYPFVVPPVARSMMFSKGAQQGLLKQGGGPGLLSNSIDEALPLMYRMNGLLGNR